MSCRCQTCEIVGLGSFLAWRDSQKLMSEQIIGCGSAVWIRFKTVQDKCFGFSGHGFRNLRMDLKHSNLHKHPKWTLIIQWTTKKTFFILLYKWHYLDIIMILSIKVRFWPWTWLPVVLPAHRRVVFPWPFQWWYSPETRYLLAFRTRVALYLWFQAPCTVTYLIFTQIVVNNSNYNTVKNILQNKTPNYLKIIHQSIYINQIQIQMYALVNSSL